MESARFFALLHLPPTLQALKLAGAYYIGSESIAMSRWGLEKNENGFLIERVSTINFRSKM